jgi:hypothetical protein
MNSQFKSQLKSMSQRQQIVATAMMMNPNMMPDFPESTEILKLGLTIKTLFDNKLLSHISLDELGDIVIY